MELPGFQHKKTVWSDWNPVLSRCPFSLLFALASQLPTVLRNDCFCGSYQGKRLSWRMRILVCSVYNIDIARLDYDNCRIKIAILLWDFLGDKHSIEANTLQITWRWIDVASFSAFVAAVILLFLSVCFVIAIVIIGRLMSSFYQTFDCQGKLEVGFQIAVVSFAGVAVGLCLVEVALGIVYLTKLNDVVVCLLQPINKMIYHSLPFIHQKGSPILYAVIVDGIMLLLGLAALATIPSRPKTQGYSRVSTT